MTLGARKIIDAFQVVLCHIQSIQAFAAKENFRSCGFHSNRINSD